MTKYLVIGTASIVPLAVSLACSLSPATAVQPTSTVVSNTAVPTIQAAPTDVVPTANTLRTQIAPTVNAVATQVAPTLIAVQTQVAPTLDAIGTEVVPTVNAAATTTAESALRITGAQLASSEPTITVQNDGNQMLDLSGWTLQVGDTPVKLPPNTEVGAGQSVVLHGSSGTTETDNLYLGTPFQTALNALQPGARVVLENPSGVILATFTVPAAQ